MVFGNHLLTLTWAPPLAEDPPEVCSGPGPIGEVSLQRGPPLGKVMGNPWKNWENHGKTMGKPWENG